MPKTYTHKATEIEALQLTPATFKEALEFLGETNVTESSEEECVISLNTEEGDRDVHANDYIIKGVLGKIYPCTAEVFEASYEVKA